MVAVANGSPSPKVAIIGAGLTGLLTAQGLKKNGFQVTVYEKDPSIDARARDWTILLHWATPTMAKLLDDDIVQNLPRAICNPHLTFDADVECLPCYNGITGDLLFKSPLPGSRRISRQKLREVLAEGLDIKWGKALDQITVSSDDDESAGPVRLTFTDGQTDEADFVLGADGTSSKVRELLLGVEAARAQRSGFMIATGIAKYHDADKVAAVIKAHPVAAIAMGMEVVAGCGVLSVPDPADMSTWTTFWTKIWRGSSTEVPRTNALDHIQKSTRGLCEPFQSLIDWTPAGSPCYVDEMKYWVPIPFDNRSGQVTLAGDAAHPMLIYRGQGFQHAIVDASNYVDALIKIRDARDTKIRAEIMSSYDSEMIERSAKSVKQSLQEAEYSMNPETVGKMLMAKHGHGRSA